MTLASSISTTTTTTTTTALSFAVKNKRSISSSRSRSSRSCSSSSSRSFSAGRLLVGRQVRRRRDFSRRTDVSVKAEEEDAVDNALFGGGNDDGDDNDDGKTKKNKKKQLGSKGVNLFDPAATLSRALTKRFGIVGGLSLVAVLALVEGGEIVKSLLEIDKDVDEQSETVTESGLGIKDIRIGGGGMPNKGNFVGIEVKMSNAEDPTVVYVDTKKTGKPIAFIYKNGKPLLTPLCEGIVEGVSTMKRGGIRELRIPAEKLGFGANDVVLADGVTKIKGGTDLLVRVELVDVTSYYQ